MTAFFLTIRDSIYSPSHYAAVLTSSNGKALGYFFLLIALLSGIHAIYLGVTQFSGLGSDIEEGIDQVMAGYPPGATVRISDGEVTTSNLQQPLLSWGYRQATLAGGRCRREEQPAGH